MKIKKIVGIGISLCSILAISACSDNDSMNKKIKSYELTVSNLTSNQPFSPLAVVIHDEKYSAWSIGGPSSTGLEHLAESGSVSDFLSEADDSGAFKTETGSGLIIPGESETLELESKSSKNLKLTLASMLVTVSYTHLTLPTKA